MRTLLIVVFLAAPCIGAADVPPPPGFQETCTVEKQCKADEEGATCGANYAERDKCKKLHAGDGYVYRCNTYGASVWTEVWCRPKAKRPPKKK